MAGTSYTASLRGGGPWGFRLQGGKDFGSPLAISKVTPGSKADLGGLKSGDHIREVNGDTTENMSHFEAQDSVRRAGQNLDLLLERKEGTKTVSVTETVHSAKMDHKFNARAKPFGASSPPSQTPQPSVPVAVHSSPAGNTSWQPPTFQAQRAPVARTGPAGLSGPPTPPPPPYPATYARGSADHPDSGVSRPSHDDTDLAQHFKLDISDGGDDLPPPPPEAYNEPE